MLSGLLPPAAARRPFCSAPRHIAVERDQAVNTGARGRRRDCIAARLRHTFRALTSQRGDIDFQRYHVDSFLDDGKGAQVQQYGFRRLSPLQTRSFRKRLHYSVLTTFP